MILLTDPTLVSINHIQKAIKQADNGFNGAVAQLYDKEFKTQEKAREEHIKQAKEKAIEEQRIEQEKLLQQLRVEEEKARAAKEESERIERERVEASKVEHQPNIEIQQSTVAESPTIGFSWGSVSPSQAASYMASKTGVAQSVWESVIFRESSNNPTVTNSIGCFGYLQLHPVHGNVSAMTPQQYLDTAVGVYNSQGLSAWEVVTLGMVN